MGGARGARKRRGPRAAGTGLALALTAALTAACGGGSGSSGSGGADGEEGGGGPVRVAACEGAEIRLPAPASRIVTSDAAALEILLRLGAGDRVIGTGFPPAPGALPADLDARARDVPVLGETLIDRETLLASGADAYVESFVHSSDGGATGRPTDEEFAAAGVTPVPLLATACDPAASERQDNLTLVEEDILRLGTLTGTAERAAELIAEMEQRLAPVRAFTAGVPQAERPDYFLFDYDAGTRQPMAVCNRQTGHAVITEAGARNVFASCDEAFRPTGWEEVVAADPDWIQLAVRARGSEAEREQAFDEAEEFLRTFAGTRDLAAVREGRFLRIGSEETTLAGVRTAETAREIAEALYPGRIDGANEADGSAETGGEGR
ncbi:ABC transporter substrate-binding protein [Streptomyces sp. DSM 44917]|uniref:ABC transporter substrate-binding protein n=1 Tax=Streptomyces boetiae TaxID=3075541 RepID=A0ABU2LBP5_9ACTN|nr:ABC transporter substrate-binding protein [Streptomyces sp. DSM 44917]MDT0309002.1 ABC transporter substrate-binding protein [Streptomyces sp. DSM 44917]